MRLQSHRNVETGGRAAVIAALSLLLIPAQVSAQIFSADSCTVSVLNQIAIVQADGTWNVPNVPSNMGPVRERVTCVDNGQTLSGASDFFTITPNRMNAIPRIELGTGAATPEAITLTLPATSLSSVGQTAQATVTAQFPDGSSLDVTAASGGTVYSSTNSAVATVDASGLVTAQASGRVLISALHEAFDYDPLTAVLGVGPRWTIPILDTFTFFGVDQIALHPAGTKLYVSQPGALNVYDASTGQLLTQITSPSLVRPTGICFPQGL